MTGKREVERMLSDAEQEEDDQDDVEKLREWIRSARESADDQDQEKEDET